MSPVAADEGGAKSGANAQDQSPTTEDKSSVAKAEKKNQDASVNVT